MHTRVIRLIQVSLLLITHRLDRYIDFRSTLDGLDRVVMASRGRAVPARLPRKPVVLTVFNLSRSYEESKFVYRMRLR